MCFSFLSECSCIWKVTEFITDLVQSWFRGVPERHLSKPLHNIVSLKIVHMHAVATGGLGPDQAQMFKNSVSPDHWVRPKVGAEWSVSPKCKNVVNLPHPSSTNAHWHCQSLVHKRSHTAFPTTQAEKLPQTGTTFCQPFCLQRPVGGIFLTFAKSVLLTTDHPPQFVKPALRHTVQILVLKQCKRWTANCICPVLSSKL